MTASSTPMERTCKPDLQAQLFVPASSTSMPKDGFLTGLLTFKEFASGDWPFKGRKTPKNPHDKGTPEHADWQRGYDAALVEWFS
jgi:hypothetical protein